MRTGTWLYTATNLPAGHDPSGSDITTVDFGTQALGKWVDIPATAAQLAELGVDLMRNVSGTGEYTLTFTTPDGWSETTGAYLDVTYGKDQIGAITVNGVTIQANNASNQVDLGGLLVPGENTLTVKMSSTLYGRMYVEKQLLRGSRCGLRHEQWLHGLYRPRCLLQRTAERYAYTLYPDLSE